MTSDDKDSFELITAMQNAKARAEDWQRHNDAIAERNNGYRNRHSVKDDARAIQSGRRSDVTLTALEEALKDPEYAAAYERVSDLLSRAETATENALADAKADLEGMMENAAKLPDGRAVFKDEHGNVWTEDGELVEPDVAAGIQWPDGAASYEDYLNAKKRIEDLETYLYDILGPARDKMDDPKNPPSRNDLRGIEGDLLAKPPPEVADEISPPKAETIEGNEKTFHVDMPALD